MAKKSLGQHWLTDISALEAITEAAEIKPSDTVLEIGPGLGSLTSYLVDQAADVIAIELDEQLAAQLPSRVSAPNLRIIQADIMQFNLEELPASYKVVANIPYYLTSNLLRRLAESINPPHMMVLLVQKEVAERICAEPGQMSLLGVSVQLYYQAELGMVVPKELFAPPPKVDSRAVILTRHLKPLFNELDSQKFFQVVKAGFSERRKKLRGSLSGGLGLTKTETDELLRRAGINGDLRAQNLNLEQWHELYKELN